ncbi:glycosyl transferase [Lentinula aciculospora]|uniref:UDP-N-acetylglucosamine transferase subunit ALG13 n=1 Tax=Lentinula aciculospora TaxID=153920 RepID=A0A9W9ASB3_9AGAR|nr:glycosyl transferase [Lentinula aciculospora]
MLAFITVGSTRFDGLIQSVFSTPVLTNFSNKGYTNIVVQCGNSEFPHVHLLAQGEQSFQLEKDGLLIECWKFKPSLQEDYERADLIISHAGSGTIVDVLRMDKPLIVVPNPTLLDNHQEELASALEELGHLRSSTISQLANTIQEFNPSSLTKFPPFDGSRFRNLLDEEMGFI